MSIKGVNMALEAEQGIGFSFIDGNFPMPSYRGAIRIVDDDDKIHVLVIDASDGKIWDITATKINEYGDIVNVEKDKLNIDNSGGYNIETELVFKEDTGESDRFKLQNLSGKYFIRKKTNNVVSVSSYCTKDGELVTESYVENIKGDDVSYDKVFEGNSLQHSVKITGGSFEFLGRHNTYLVKDVRQLEEETTEQALQLQLLNFKYYYDTAKNVELTTNNKYNYDSVIYDNTIVGRIVDNPFIINNIEYNITDIAYVVSNAIPVAKVGNDNLVSEVLSTFELTTQWNIIKYTANSNMVGNFSLENAGDFIVLDMRILPVACDTYYVKDFIINYGRNIKI